MCDYPKLIRNPKYIPNKKNGWHPPKPNDPRKLWVPIGCGECLQCREQYANQWKTRLGEELKNCKWAQFVTLTFNEESLNRHKKLCFDEENINEIATVAIRRFNERWRKKYKKSPRHWLITEMGHNGTERLHLHGIIFEKENVEERWQNGYVFIGNRVNESTINYIVKYCSKIDTDHPDFKGKVLCSPGIGKKYLERAFRNKYKGKETNTTIVLNSGNKINMPIYYRNHLYTEEQREELWMSKLDLKIQWVNGQAIKVGTPEGEKELEKALLYRQKMNQEQGYGTRIAWKKEEQREKRKILENKNF